MRTDNAGRELRLTRDPRILVVDDQPEIAEHVQLILEREGGYRSVRRVGSAAEAIAVCREEKQDIVITDIMMPGIDGVELLKRLKSFHDTSGIVLSSDDSYWREAIRSKPIEDYLVKPVKAEQLLEAVRGVLANKADIRRYTEELNDLVEERTAELRLNERLSIKYLALYAEYSDAGTGAHLDRMQSYVEYVAAALKRRSPYREYLETKPAYIREVGLASILHDLGKMKVPEEILNKPGKLTPEEFEVIRTHTTIGAQFLKMINDEFYSLMRKDSHMALARDIAHAHHERWDGSGYPRGLKGEEIPLSARIVTFCDIYDALRSERPYKRGWTHAEAVAEIYSLSGTTFEPRMLEILEPSLPGMDDICSALAAREGLPPPDPDALSGRRRPVPG